MLEGSQCRLELFRTPRAHHDCGHVWLSNEPRDGKRRGVDAALCCDLCEAVELHLADEDLESLGLIADPTIIVTRELTSAHA